MEPYTFIDCLVYHSHISENYFHPRILTKKSEKNQWKWAKSDIHFGNCRYERISLWCSSWINNLGFMINLTHLSLSQNHNITVISKWIFVSFSSISTQFLKKRGDFVIPQLPCPLHSHFFCQKTGSIHGRP